MLINFFVKNFIILFFVGAIFNILAFFAKLNYYIFFLIYIVLFLYLYRKLSLVIRSRSIYLISIFTVLPFLFIIFVRFPLVYPMYDDMSYHLSSSFFALKIFDKNHFMPISGLETYPLFLQYVYGFIFRLLGYRVSLLFFGLTYAFWIISLISRILEKINNKKPYWLLSILVLYGFMQNYVIATSATFMTDIPLILLSLECFWQIYFCKSSKNINFGIVLYFFTILAKPSTGFFTLPIFVILILSKINKITILSLKLIVIYVSLYFLGHFWATGNPFPGGYFNNYFQSIVFNKSGFSLPKDDRFGPTTVKDVLFWPFIGYFSGRFSEIEPVKLAKFFYYPYFLFGLVFSIILIIIKRFKVSPLIYSVLFSYYFWSNLNGYSRYASGFVVLSSIVVYIYLIKSFDSLSSFLLALDKKLMYFGVIFLSLLSLISYRSDYAWRSYPSLKDMYSTKLYFSDYINGLGYVFHDTPQTLSDILSSQVSKNDFNFIVPYYRGNATFYSAMLSYANNNDIHVVYIYPNKYNLAKDFLGVRDGDKILFIITEDYISESLRKTNCGRHLIPFNSIVIKHRIEKVLWSICEYQDLKTIYHFN